MSANNYKTKRNRKNKFMGLLIIILLSIATILCFTNNPFEIFSNVANATPTLTLSANNSDYNNDKIDSSLNRNLILVNKKNPIPDDYKVDLVELSNGHSVDRYIYPALQEMFDTARAQGIYPVVASGYRTKKQQQFLLDQKISAYTAEGLSAHDAVVKAKEWVATPGTSEHQLGIAVDINADGINSNSDEVYKWLAQNAHNFGFICRYPADKTNITGISYEPWHYRYVGVTAATEIYQQGVCLEEYLDTLN